MLLGTGATGILWPAPGPASAAGGVAAVSAGGSHTCAVTMGGGLKCWGFNTAGQLGDGTTTDRSAPADVSGLGGDVAAVAAGTNHTCAVTTAGGLKCWGFNTSGQVGDGTSINRDMPANVSGLSGGVAAVSAGDSHTCALTAKGGLKCWGNNVEAQLGDGSTTNRSIPVDVSGLTSGVVAVTAGLYHTCALTTTGGLKCWGDNFSGQLGDGSTTNRSIPTDVVGLTSGVTAIAAGASQTCAVTAASGLKCWGANISGQLGDGTMTNQSTPVDVSGLTGNVVAVTAAKAGYTCALTKAGDLKCWGDNYHGGLGDGTTTNRNTPVDVSGLTNGVVAASAGAHHTCAVTTAGGLKCWGDNVHGQLGDAVDEFVVTPIDVSGLGPKPIATPAWTATPTPTRSPPVTSTPTLARAGDVNCDGTVNAIDAALVLQYGAGLAVTLACQQNADVNHDGSINAVDAALVLQFGAGLLPHL